MLLANFDFSSIGILVRPEWENKGTDHKRM
jgi:hypothetical protein